MQRILGNRDEGLVFVISAPAGTGKTTLVEKLTKEFPPVIKSISYTTRLPRPGEVDGEDYFFINTDEFEKMILEGMFLEYVRLFDCYYGTSKQWVIDRQKQGMHIVLVIDTQGAMRLRGGFPAVFIFIKPPSLEELSLRLQKRQTETQEMIEKRLAWAQIELDKALYYDYEIVNDDLKTAYEVLRSIFIAEEHRVTVR